MRDPINFFVQSNLLLSLVTVIFILISTWILAQLSGWVAVRMLMARSLTWRRQIREKRLLTLQSLVRGAITALVYVVGFVVLLLALGVPAGALLTTVGLFSAGFGFGARPIISDYLAGFILIFEDQFSVGDKVEMLEVVGLVERVDLRVTHIRSTTGELYIVPNGDVRVVRNLSRGLFSVANVKVTVATEDLARAMEALEQVADNVQQDLGDLIERPKVLSEEGSISAHVELTLSAKANYGRGAWLRTQLMARVTQALKEAGVRIIN